MERLIFSLLVFLAPTQLAYHFWPDWAHVFGIRVDYLAPTVYLTDVLVLFLIVIRFYKWFKTQNSKVKGQSFISKFKTTNKALIFLGIFVVLNVLLAKSPYPAAFKWLKVLRFVFLSYYVATNKQFNLLKWFIRPLTFSVLFFSLLGIVQFLKGGTIGGPFYLLGERSFSMATPGIALASISGRDFLRAYSTFSHPNSMAGYLLISLILIMFYQTKGKLKTLSLLAGGAALFLSFSLGAFLAAGVALIYYYVFKNNPTLRSRFSYLITGVIVGVSIISPVLANYFRAMQFPESVSQRLALMESSGKVFSKSPIFGVGLNNFLVASSSLQPVHNIFLLVLSETGIIGLFLFLYLIINAFENSLRIDNWELVIPVLVILITGLVDHYWLTLQQNELLLSLIFGLSLRRDEKHS